MTKSHPNSANKKDLTNELAERANIPKTKAAAYINMLTDIISESLIDGKKVIISDFGTFNLSARSAFKGYDPKNKKNIQIPSRTIPSFRAGKKLKTSLNIPSIRHCDIVESNQVLIEFFKVPDEETARLQNVKSYQMTFVDGTQAQIAGISFEDNSSEFEDKDGKVKKINRHRVILTLKNAMPSENFTLSIEIPYVDMNNEACNVPLIWTV